MREGKSQEQVDKLDLKDDVLCRANGFYTYFAADIAYHRNKLEVRGFDKAINIWGADHHGLSLIHISGLCLALRGRGKTAWVLENPEATSLFTPYLEGLTAPEGWSPDTVVSVDIAARGLFPENARCYLERVDLAIDHHPSQEF